MSEIERVEYTPVSVRETLILMKNISELMIDLAYSSALFDNIELAGEVMALEKKMDNLVYILNMNLMLAARDREDAETLAGVAKVGSLTNSISDAAADIADIVLNKIGVHPIVREVFQHTEEHLVSESVLDESIIIGSTVNELDLAAKVGVNIIAIRRGKHWTINPEKEVVLPEDVLLARGTASGLDEVRLLFEKICTDLVELKDTSEMMMDLAYSALLLNSRYLAEEVLLLEDSVDELHTEFELKVLMSIKKTDDIKGILGLIRIGVVTERIADAAAEIAEVALRSGETHPVLRMVIEDAKETVERAVVSEESSIAGKTLREARIPEETGMWVLVIRRGKKWMRPKPTTVIQVGDVILASGYSEGEDDFVKFVGTSSPKKEVF
jgi:uncharacterized protein with PhoU and TrkA domain